MKQNLLYVITKLELGGAQKQLLSLIINLDKAKFNLFLFTAKDGLLIEDALSIRGLNLKRSKWLNRSINPLKDFLALIEIYWFIRKNKIEAIHTHSSKAGILGRFAGALAGVKIIIHTVHGWSFNDYQPGLEKVFFIWLERFSAKWTDKLVVVSGYDKQKGLKNCIGKENKYRFIPYGIDRAEFSGQQNKDIRNELGLSAQDLVVGMVSCFKPQKSPLDFIELANLIKPGMARVKFILIGDGILRKKIEKLILEFGLQKQVILAGWRRDVSRILSAIDVFALTSLWEGLPISVLEAMVASKAVVATHTGGISEVIIEGKTGFLVAPHDMGRMRDKLIVLLKDENLRREIGKNAMVSLDDNFSIQNMVKKNVFLYNDIL